MRTKARRFLAGLSADELQFIAEYLGACVLESRKELCASRAQVAERIARYQEACTCADQAASMADREHKMILLLEYLCGCRLLHLPLPARVRQMS